VRLQRIKAEYGEQVSISWKSYPLLPQSVPGRRPSAHTQEGRLRAARQEPSIVFKPWGSADLPSSSLPALESAKCAERQGAETMERFHMLLFRAYFEESRDISRRQVLVELAEEAGLAVEQFEAELNSGAQRSVVMREYAEAVARFGVSSIPTAILNEKLALIGAVPIEEYRHLIDGMLAGEPGGVAPWAEPQDKEPGQP